MKFLFNLALTGAVLAGCQTRGYNTADTKEAISIEDMRGNMRTWKNPTVDSTPKSGLPNPGLNLVAEGLILIGPDGREATQFDRNKPTVIYIHGWTPEENVPPIPFTAAWYKDFNTFMYRWHRQSGERAPAPFRTLTNVERVQKSFLADFDRLQIELGAKLGQYDKEIRVVGYSLGSMIAVSLGENSRFMNDASMGRPRRVEFLEMIVDDTNVQNVIENRNYVIQKYDLNKYLRLTSALVSSDVAMVNYLSSPLSGITAALAMAEMNVQHYSSKWINSDFRARHTELLPAYFESYGKATPTIVNSKQAAFSASSKHEDLKDRTVWLEQVSSTESGDKSLSTRDLSDDSFQRKEKPCNPGFFMGVDAGLYNMDGSIRVNGAAYPLKTWCH